MADLIIHDEDVAFRLLEIARREERPVEAVLKSMLAQYRESESDDSEPKPGTLAMLAKKAVEANIRSGNPVDTAVRSREILNEEYADYIRRRMDEQSDSD